jgi:hypothetical protein
MSRKTYKKASRKSSRKVSRKVSRKSSRKSSRKASRKSTRKMMYGGRRSSCMMRGGNPMNQSLAQGVEYAKIHANQHGGAAVSLAAAAPVGDTGMLDSSLRAIARIAPLDQAVNQIQGMSDQSGGGKRKGRKSMFNGKTMKRNLKMMRKRLMKMMRKMTRRGKKMFGGAPADYGAPGMLLSPAMEAKALAGMNPEWKLATDPNSFAPKMA